MAPDRRALVEALRWLDLNAERAMMLPLYAFIALIVGGEAVFRYVVGTQTQWGGTMAIHAFVFLSWLGCAYHVRRRTHLGFDGLRRHMPPRLRCAACAVDDLLWIALAIIVVRYSFQMVEMQVSLESTVEGTDTIPLWLITATVPLSWSIIVLRAVQDLVLLFSQARRGKFDISVSGLAAAVSAESTASKT